MREDMFEVIIERPRWGSRIRYSRRNRRVDDKITSRKDPDSLPFLIGLERAAKGARFHKRLSETLNPLRRYLESQVNRPWNKVWSEICENLKTKSTVQQHVRDHVADFIATNVVSKDGALWVRTHWRDLIKLSESQVSLYVDPRTGILRANKHRKTWRQARREKEAAEAKERATRMRELGPNLQVHRFDDGAWWEVSLAPIPWEPAPAANGGVSSWQRRSMLYRDVVCGTTLTDLSPEDLYGRFGVYAVAKRQLARREVIKLGLSR